MNAKAVAELIRVARLKYVGKVVSVGARLVAFYYGFEILHHEVYETETSEPLLIFLGLWLCGIAPATFFDSARKFSASVQEEMKKATDLENVTEVSLEADKPAKEEPTT